MQENIIYKTFYDVKPVLPLDRDFLFHTGCMSAHRKNVRDMPVFYWNLPLDT